ncbi:hypothetical protein [Polluticoccus soli]|uniref:hypothetical protein n=1 Tax=Polluticoccus soli TaxID=3034150 RepID=UPI0023E27DDE|nr:hypothetical protein [Flavipsychrobacter sp. JY13-12]
MKALPQSSEARWSDDLVNEMSYIRQHLKYRPKAKRLLPAVFSGIFLILLLITIAASVYDRAGRGERPATLSILMAIAVVTNFSASIIRYLQSLKFISVPTDYHIAENRVLVQEFLKLHHLAFSQHPDIPEVFQILSRNISAGEEDREILLFIADDKRILLNSHFTSVWSFFARKRHHNEMARMLNEYINNLDHSTGLMHQTF